jgi:hypothetical protein
VNLFRSARRECGVGGDEIRQLLLACIRDRDDGVGFEQLTHNPAADRTETLDGDAAALEISTPVDVLHAGM